MKYYDFLEMTGIIADSFHKLSVAGLYGLDYEELAKIPKVNYPKEVYEYLVTNSNMIEVADQKIYLVGFQWQILYSL